MPQGNPAQARLDAMAKQKGFPSYAAMKAWNAKYRKPTTGTGPAAAPKKQNFFQTLMSNAPHPGTLINKVTDRIRGAKKGARNVRPD